MECLLMFPHDFSCFGVAGLIKDTNNFVQLQGTSWTVDIWVEGAFVVGRYPYTVLDHISIARDKNVEARPTAYGLYL